MTAFSRTGLNIDLTKADHMPTFTGTTQRPLNVTILGSGNWGTAIACLVGETAAESHIFNNEVSFWVREELVDGKILADIINEKHENVKYLPGVTIPNNIVAKCDIVECVKDADLIVIVVPHQFAVSIATSISNHVKPTAKGITLVKGLHIENNMPRVFSDIFEEILNIDFCALSGANVAKDVANRDFSETTIGFRDGATVALWAELFDRPYFKVRGVPDVRGVQVCGAIKNLVALAAGFSDGLGRNSNAKSAIMRAGIEEMKLFCSLFFDGILQETFFDSSGFADVITTCYGGRNVRCAAEFIRRPNASWEEIEEDILKGQKMQGQLTCDEVYRVLEAHQLLDFFPLFHVVYKIAFKGEDPNKMFDNLSVIPQLSLGSPYVQRRAIEDVKSPFLKRSQCQSIFTPKCLQKFKQGILDLQERDHMGVIPHKKDTDTTH